MGWPIGEPPLPRNPQTRQGAAPPPVQSTGILDLIRKVAAKAMSRPVLQSQSTEESMEIAHAFGGGVEWLDATNDQDLIASLGVNADPNTANLLINEPLFRRGRTYVPKARAPQNVVVISQSTNSVTGGLATLTTTFGSSVRWKRLVAAIGIVWTDSTRTNPSTVQLPVRLGVLINNLSGNRVFPNNVNGYDFILNILNGSDPFVTANWVIMRSDMEARPGSLDGAGTAVTFQNTEPFLFPRGWELVWTVGAVNGTAMDQYVLMEVL